VSAVQVCLVLKVTVTDNFSVRFYKPPFLGGFFLHKMENCLFGNIISIEVVF